jgi:Ca2+/Na+ antiporter
MKSIDILVIGIRLVGIVFILRLVQYLSESYESIYRWTLAAPEESLTFVLLIYGTFGLAFAVICFILIKFPLTVSRWLLPKSKDDEPVFNGSIDDLRIAAFTIIGVYIVSWAIPDLFYNVSMLVKLQSETAVKLYSSDSIIDFMIRTGMTVLEIFIGLYLCLQAKGLNNLILKFRGLGAQCTDAKAAKAGE